MKGIISGGIIGGINELVSDRLSLIIKFIWTMHSVFKKPIRETLKIPLRTLDRDMEILKKKDRVLFVGSKKSGSYILSEIAREKIEGMKK